jgi:DNA-binding GntR family transcriptional regulator
VLEDISVLIVRKAARNARDARNRRRLKDSLKAASEFRRKTDSVSQVSAFMDENFRFWGALADVAGNPVLSEIRLRLQSQLARFAYQGVTIDGNKDMWISWHEEVIEDLLEGKAAQAVRHARKAMSDVWEAILRLPDSAFGH